jgi:peptidoglycan hydrolase FlgJ
MIITSGRPPMVGATAADQTATGAITPALMKAGKEFEAMAIGEMLQPMFATSESGGEFDGGAAETTLKPLLVSEYAKLFEARGGLGLAETVATKLATEMDRSTRR